MSRLAVAVLSTALLAASTASAAGEPITGIQFDWSTFQQRATGSGNFPTTWCEDDHQYTAWGNGGGFGGTSTDGRVSLGFARLEGPYESFTGVNVWGGKDPLAPATFTGKVISLFCLGGNLYAWHTPGSSEENFQWNQLIRSTDKGLSWEKDVFPQSRIDGCAGCPGLAYTVQFGRNHEASWDGYVYTYWIQVHDPALWEVQAPGVLWLVRAPAAGEAFADAANWQWLTGFDATSGEPQWGALADRAPVLEDPDGFLRGSATYVPGLDLFLMVTNHTTRNGGHLSIWQAPDPWGPWSIVMTEDDFPDSEPQAPAHAANFSRGNFAPKWWSTNGRSGVFVWSGGSWNSVRFDVLPEPGGLATAAGAGLALLALGRSRRRR